ncbi:hypothetical protein K438DRAFT_1943149 [Mycena galopus ATCC 62051]|nr:hypothetical protein K438DRAFT_1943149 [Mycena galopus ATCC 62051]
MFSLNYSTEIAILLQLNGATIENKLRVMLRALNSLPVIQPAGTSWSKLSMDHAGDHLVPSGQRLNHIKMCRDPQIEFLAFPQGSRCIGQIANSRERGAARASNIPFILSFPASPRWASDASPISDLLFTFLAASRRKKDTFLVSSLIHMNFDTRTYTQFSDAGCPRAGYVRRI